MQQCMYKTKICDIYDVQKCLTQAWIDFEHNVIEAAIDQWRDRLRSCVRASGGHFEHMLWNIVYLYYVVHQNILWNLQRNLVHLMAILELTLKAEFVFICIFGVST